MFFVFLALFIAFSVSVSVFGSESEWTIKCLRFPDLTEHCKYKGGICFDGSSYILRDSDGEIKAKLEKFGNEVDFGDHLFTLPKNLNPVQDSVKPWNIKNIILKTKSSEEWDMFAQNVTNIENIYFVHLDSPRSNSHQYLFTRSVAMLIDPQLHNTTYANWFPALTDIVINENEENIFAPNIQLLKQIAPNDANIHFVGSGKTPICTKMGVIEGYRNTIFRGSRDALFWKRKVYDTHNIPGRKMTSETLYPLKVLIFNPSHQRRFENPSIEEITHQLLYGSLSQRNGTRVNTFNISVYDEDQLHASFPDLINAFASSHIIIMPHDPAITYTMFTDVHVPFIEIFPYNYIHDAYRRLTSIMGRTYFEMMANPTSLEFYGPNENTQTLCQKWAPEDMQETCHQDIHRFSPIHINMTILERMVSLAIEASPLSASPSRRSSSNPIVPPPIEENQ